MAQTDFKIEICARALALGLISFLRFSKKYYWVSRYSVAITTRVITGTIIPTVLDPEFLKQINMVVLPIATPDIFTDLNNLLIIGCTACVTYYFLFTFTFKSGTRIATADDWIHKLGRYVMMIGMGVAICQSISTRLSSKLTVLKYLLQT